MHLFHASGAFPAGCYQRLIRVHRHRSGVAVEDDHRAGRNGEHFATRAIHRRQPQPARQNGGVTGDGAPGHAEPQHQVFIEQNGIRRGQVIRRDDRRHAQPGGGAFGHPQEQPGDAIRHVQHVNGTGGEIVIIHGSKFGGVPFTRLYKHRLNIGSPFVQTGFHPGKQVGIFGDHHMELEYLCLVFIGIPQGFLINIPQLVTSGSQGSFQSFPFGRWIAVLKCFDHQLSPAEWKNRPAGDPSGTADTLNDLHTLTSMVDGVYRFKRMNQYITEDISGHMTIR